MLVIDDHTRYSWLFPLFYKSEVKTTLEHFKTYVENQFHTVKAIRSNNGKEFVNHFLTHLFLIAGILHQTSLPYTPEKMVS